MATKVLDNYIIWDGKDSRDYGIIVRKNPSFPRAARKHTSVNVPGRNGNIYLFQNAWENYDQTYELFIGTGDENSTAEAMEKVAEWLAVDETHEADYEDYINLTVNGYHTLIDSYEPNVIRLATLTRGFSANNMLGYFGHVSVTFNCRPERFTESAFTPINVQLALVTITNPASMPSKPSIMIAGGGECSVEINGVEIYLPDAPYDRQIVVDSELQDCYYADDLSNANNMIVLADGFPTIMPGENVFQGFGFDFSWVKIVPRWWNL